MSMTPEQLKNLSREECLFLIGHELMRRLFEIEPKAVAIDNTTGRGSVLATTEEGAAIGNVLRLIDDMVRVQ